MNYKEKVIIAVDAGGTSTRLAIIDENKNILDTLVGPPGNKAVYQNAIIDLVDNIDVLYQRNKDSYSICAIVMGMSGIAIVDTKKLEETLIEKYGVKVEMENDAFMALYSALTLDYKNGLVIISGTGAIIEAINNEKTCICNGWGQLLTERGSGYTVVKDYVCQMIHHNEQRGYYSVLEEKFLDYVGIKRVEDFKPIFYLKHKDDVAKLCKFFILEANSNNQEAIEWLYYNGTLLGIDAVSALRKVNMDKEFALGLRGGFMKDNEHMIKGILDTIQKEGYKPIIVLGDDNPIYGAYYLAKKKGYF